MSVEEQESSSLKIDEVFGELEQIVGKLEVGELPLEEALQLFAQGMSLCDVGHARLRQAEQTIETLLKRESSNTPEEPTE